MNLPIGLEILQMSIHGEINVNGWLSRLIYLNTFHARFATLTSDESAPQPTFPRSLTDLRVNGMKPLTMSDSLPNGLVTFSWFSTVTNSFGSFPMSATTSIIDANAACAKSLRVYKTDVTVYTFLSSIALPPLLTVLHLNPTGFGFAAVQQVQSLEEMPWKSIATLTDLNLGPYTFASELFPKALPPNITKLAIKLSECLIATSSMESTRPKERLWFPPSLTHIISLSQAPSRQSPPDLGVFKWLPTREEFPGMLVFTIVSRALHTYARGPSGYISYSTDTEWTSTLEAFLEDVPELLESWWCPATRSFGPFHDIVLHEHPFSMLVSNDSSKCINWLSEHAPGLCSDFAFCERLRREEDPEDHHLIGHSEKKTSTQIALQKGLLDVYKWLTIYGFRSVPNVVHLALDRPWDPEFLKWVATHGADLDIPNHLGITPLTRTLISKTAPEIAKWEYLLSLGATQLSWDAILQKMLSTGNLEYLELIQKAFSGIKGVATFRHLRNAFSQSFISNTVAPATISILDAMVKSEILVISGPNVQEMAQSALEQVLLKTMPRSPDWYLSLFKWFVELGIDIKLTPYFGAYGTIVHYGAKSGHLALVEYLDSLGVNWDQLDTNEHSPLKIAEAAGFAEIAAYLRPKTTAKSIDWKPPQWDSTVLTATASWEAFEANTVVFGRKSVANKASAKSGVGEQTLATSSETPATINSTTKVTSNPTITTNEQTSTPKISAVRPTLPRPAAVPSMTLYSKPPSRFESEDDTGEDDERETPVAPKKTASHPKSGITAKRPLNAIFGLPKATSSTNGSDSSGPTQKTGLGDTGSNPTSAAPKKAPLLNIFKFGPAKASSSVTEVEKTKDQ
jgi:ankyrin repeat protein